MMFLVLCALLALIALAFVLRPLLRRGAGGAGVSRSALNASVYRDQLRELESDVASGMLASEDYARARSELERRVLEEVAEEASAAPRPRRRLAALLVGLAVPLCALGLYLAIGTPEGMDPTKVAGARDVTPQQVAAMVERLAQKLKEHPEDAEGWKLLGRSYTVIGRFPEAADAYAKAAAREPRDAQLLADFADALAMARGQSLQGEPEKLVLRALELDPNNLKALALAGSAAFDRKDFAAAARLWERMLPHVPAQSEDARTIQANVAEARSLAGGKGAPADALRGTIKLDPKLKARAAPEDTVFIFARAAEGPAIPLAVLRKRVRELPLSFSLDDSMAMAPGMKLSGQARVIVGARVSKSGDATPKPGDLQGLSEPVASNARGVTVTIDQVLP